MHIMDLVQNSIKAGAHFIKVTVVEDPIRDLLIVQVDDDGCGMDGKMLENVFDPFYTTRATRKVGLGLPLFREAARRCGGDVTIKSEPGRGASVKGVFKWSHIDRAPLGDMAGTFAALIAANPQVDFLYVHRYDDRTFELDTRKLRKKLGEVPLDDFAVIKWINGYLREGMSNLYGGVKSEDH
ncbi:ATP-binding protein [Caldanaerobius polysaccharolyticus]|uniref:ATP-binding protein n=1 Tax=Caldanaerobius polysaccharolyticus TaxID=44256 RepID=UPI001C54E621|nr:ATP-binding protein [Caldanaerobius polysaccharolyticus]